jgi:hypothetical protein
MKWHMGGIDMKRYYVISGRSVVTRFMSDKEQAEREFEKLGSDITDGFFGHVECFSSKEPLSDSQPRVKTWMKDCQIFDRLIISVKYSRLPMFNY